MSTITGLVIDTKRVSTSAYGNPAYEVTISSATEGTDGIVTLRTMDNAGVAYCIGNSEYRDTPHIFHLTRAGRIRSAEPAGL